MKFHSKKPASFKALRYSHSITIDEGNERNKKVNKSTKFERNASMSFNKSTKIGIIDTGNVICAPKTYTVAFLKRFVNAKS